jgi:hypothetical protein
MEAGIHPQQTLRCLAEAAARATGAVSHQQLGPSWWVEAVESATGAVTHRQPKWRFRGVGAAQATARATHPRLLVDLRWD